MSGPMESAASWRGAVASGSVKSLMTITESSQVEAQETVLLLGAGRQISGQSEWDLD